MKRTGSIYEQVYSRENISKALFNAMKNKSHYRDVKRIKNNPEKYIDQLEKMLKEESFVNGEYEIIERRSGGKLRQLYKLPFFPDRVVHHCIMQVVSQLWTRNLIYDTFSTVPGRGPHLGARRVKNAVKDKEGARYCLKIDVKKYYPSIDNEILKKIIRKKIKDIKLLRLIDTIIDSARGIPIGNYISQWFGNIYLSYFDHWVKEELRCKYYFRYCDDMVLLADSKETLWIWLDQIRTYLDHKLNLCINNNYAVFPVEKRGIDFLGYRFYPGYTLVRKGIVRAMKSSLDKPKSKTSYFGWLLHADSYRLLMKYYSNELYIKKYFKVA